MRSIARPLLFLAVAIAVGLALGFFLLNRGDEKQLQQFDQPNVAITATVTPRTHLFGDAVLAQVSVVFDPDEVRPNSIRMEPDFKPYELIGDPEVEESSSGDFVRVVHRFRLQCVSKPCISSLGSKQQIKFPSGRVDYTVATVGQRSGTVFSWPEFESVTRLVDLDLQDPQWRADIRRLPEPSFRARPQVLAAGLFGGSALLVLFAGLLLTRALPRRTTTLAEEVEEGRISPLERALALLGEAGRNGNEPERRKALALLARELREVDEAELSGRAKRLAWSGQPPQNAELDTLADDVRATVRPEEAG